MVQRIMQAYEFNTRQGHKRSPRKTMSRTQNKQKRDRSRRYRRAKQMIKLFGLILASQSIYALAIYQMRQQGKQNEH